MIRIPFSFEMAKKKIKSQNDTVNVFRIMLSKVIPKRERTQIKIWLYVVSIAKEICIVCVKCSK